MNIRFNNQNGLDEMIMNQGYMSQRTKSPRRINIPQNQLFQNNQIYPNVNKLNSNRDMSPNKIIAKSKPLLIGNNTINNRVSQQVLNNNFNNNNHVQFIDSQIRYGFDMKVQQQPLNNGWKNIKNPRSPQIQNENFGNQTNRNQRCINHFDKKAQFVAQTDDELIYYCQTCAAKISSTDFRVTRLPNTYNNFNQSVKQKPTYKRRQIPCIPKYKGNPIYESIVQFLKQVYTSQQYHLETYEQLQSIDNHYQHQIQMVDEFYKQLLDILSKMHQDHLIDMEKQYKRHCQMRDIYQNQILQNLPVIDQIVVDLDQNFQTVVNRMTQQDLHFFNGALQQNRSKIRILLNQVQEQHDMFNQVISYKEQRLVDMVKQFENSLISLWDQPKQLKPQKFNFQKISQQPHQQKIIQPIKSNNQQLLKQLNNQNGQPNSNLRFNVPVSSNNVLQPNNRQNTKGQQDQKMNVLQMHQNGQKPSLTRQFEGKGACRAIFDDDQQENINQQVSPKFKVI